MTTATQTELEAPLRALIERRLDGIDRVLLAAGVSRGERCGIVEEVEAQIYEMLARRTDELPTRSDVLAVLSALDPPEAYAPEGYRALMEEERREGPQPSLLAVASAVVGVLDLLLLAWFLLVALGGSGDEGVVLALAVVGLGIPLFVSAGGIVSVIQIRASRGRLFGLPAAVFAAILFPLLLLNAVVGFALMMLGEYGLLLICGATILSGNGWLVWRLWKWLSTGLRFQQA